MCEPAFLQEVNFKQPRKGKLPEESKTLQNVVQHFSVGLPAGIPDEKLAQLKRNFSKCCNFYNLAK